MGWLGVAAFVMVIWLLTWWLDPNLRRQREFEAELKTREALSNADMMARYFVEKCIETDVPVEVREIFAKYMQYPAEKLLPDDDFAFFWAELDMRELIDELEFRFGITITNEEAARTPCTIQAVTQLVAMKSGPGTR